MESAQTSTCLRHPSQIVTGICSSCLAERLAFVDSTDRSSNSTEIVEIDTAPRRVRKTLLSLFELDDMVQNSDESVGGGEESEKDEILKDRSGRFGLGTVFSSRWRSRRSLSQRSHNTVTEAVGGQSEGKMSSFEVPRHSWDGSSVVSKALACSFACLDEPQDGSRRVGERGPSVSGNVDVGEVREVENLGNESRRKKSRRWSRVWDWSVMSPFRDFGKKRGHGFERSLSETWREGRRKKGAEIVETDNQINGHVHGHGHFSSRPNQSLNRSVNVANGELRNFSTDRQKKKEYRFGRSRSVHYSSPRNTDNGLLRFYLTPLRSSRRITGKGRMRSSHSFARGILGLH